MNFTKKLSTLAVTGVFLTQAGVSLAAGNGYGTSNCQVVYGGGEVCPESVQFSLDKKVLSPNKGGSYVDNLGFNDAKFQPGNTVAFKIIVKNTGEKTIEKLNIVDTLPANTVFTSGSASYNASNNTVSYTIDKLDPNAVNERTFVATIANADKLPKDQGVICLTNKVAATDKNGNTASDNAAFCIEKAVMNPKVFESVPVKSIPNTGPEMLALLGLIPAGIAGLLLRKKKLF